MTLPAFAGLRSAFSPILLEDEIASMVYGSIFLYGAQGGLAHRPTIAACELMRRPAKGALECRIALK
jgi:hypothetical protein